jgi:hypothetical protein
MKKLARLFLLYFMMIAIPVQGIASSVMQCGGAERHQPAFTAESQLQLHDHASDHASHAAHEDKASSAALEKSSCADCCVSCASVLQSGSPSASSSPTSEKIISILSSHNGYVNDGLERPPRV